MSALPAALPDPVRAPAPRRPELDALRGVAILLVIAHHFVVAPDQAGWFRPLAMFGDNFGWTGVDLFFVLSGFLVGGLLFEELKRRGRLDARRFLVRRAFKIWPAYFCYLATVFIFYAWLRPTEGTPLEVAWKMLPNLLHAQNYLGSLRMHTWSLAVEEHFYVALPLLLWWASRVRDRSGALPVVAPLCAALAVLCTAVRCWNSATHFEWDANYHPTHLRIDGLFLGVFLAHQYHFRPAAFARWSSRSALLLPLGLLLISPMAVLSLYREPFVSSIGLTLLYLGYACVLVAVLDLANRPGLPSRLLASPAGRALAWVGAYSYPIYLWHQDSQMVVVPWVVNRGPFAALTGEARWLVATALNVVVSVLAGYVMGRAVEKPALAVRDRLFPSRAQA